LASARLTASVTIIASSGEKRAPIKTPFALPFGSFGRPTFGFIHFAKQILGYSKKLENLKHAVALFVGHFNFCRVHSAHGQTPAQAAGLTGEALTIAELLESAI
jgi:hypothetical protein